MTIFKEVAQPAGRLLINLCTSSRSLYAILYARGSKARTQSLVGNTTSRWECSTITTIDLVGLYSTKLRSIHLHQKALPTPSSQLDLDRSSRIGNFKQSERLLATLAATLETMG